MSGSTVPAVWRLKTLRGIPYRVISLSLSVEENKARATEVLMMPQYYVVAFINESFPPRNNSENKTAIRRTRFLPGTRLQTKSITAEAHTGGRPSDFFGADWLAPANTYDPMAKVTVSYETKEQEEKTPYKVSARASGQVLTVPVPSGEWDTGEKIDQPNIPFQLMTPTVTWSVEWPSVDRNLFRETILPRLRSAVGRVNDKAMSLFFGAPEETVLFLGFDFEEQFSNAAVLAMSAEDQLERAQNADGTPSLTPAQQRDLLSIKEDQAALDNRDDSKTITINLHFSEVRKYNRNDIDTYELTQEELGTENAPKGHNHIYNPKTSKFEKIVFPDGFNMYAQTDLMKIFSTEEEEVVVENEDEDEDA